MANILKRFSWWINKLLWIPLCRLFYNDDQYASWYIVKTFLIWQKIFRINGEIPWIVHPSSVITNWNKIQMAEKCHPGMSNGNYIQAGNGIKLGKNVLIAPNVGIISANHDIKERSKWKKAGPITIGDNVWIAMNTVILPGVQIGDNVIIGAGSVVTKDIPSNNIATGNPCKVIKSLE